MAELPEKPACSQDDQQPPQSSRDSWLQPTQPQMQPQMDQHQQLLLQMRQQPPQATPASHMWFGMQHQQLPMQQQLQMQHPSQLHEQQLRMQQQTMQQQAMQLHQQQAMQQQAMQQQAMQQQQQQQAMQQQHALQYGQQPQEALHGQQPHEAQHGQQLNEAQRGQQVHDLQHGQNLHKTEHGHQSHEPQHGQQPQHEQPAQNTFQAQMKTEMQSQVDQQQQLTLQMRQQVPQMQPRPLQMQQQQQQQQYQQMHMQQNWPPQQSHPHGSQLANAAPGTHPSTGFNMFTYGLRSQHLNLQPQSSAFAGGAMGGSAQAMGHHPPGSAAMPGGFMGQSVLSHTMPGSMPSVGMGGAAEQSGQGGQPQGPPCSCGIPSIGYTVMKEGPNTGRVFFKCAKPRGEQCRYFQWADEPPQEAPPPPTFGPPCYCGQPTVTLTVKKEGANTGRQFYACSKNKEERCSYFQWSDEEAPQPGQPCLCGVPSKQRKVMKEGPNFGRLFFCCATNARCDFFEWGDNPQAKGGIPTPAGRRHAVGGYSGGCAPGGGEETMCYRCHVENKCNQPGHWAKDCPNAPDGGSTYASAGSGKGGRRGRGGRGRGRGKGKGRGKAYTEDVGLCDDPSFDGNFDGDRYAPY